MYTWVGDHTKKAVYQNLHGLTMCFDAFSKFKWFSGKMLDLRLRGCEFEPPWMHLIVSLHCLILDPS